MDFLVEDKVVVETKAFARTLGNKEIAQMIGYLVARKLPVALLINFGRQQLEFRRIFPPKSQGGVDREVRGRG